MIVMLTYTRPTQSQANQKYGTGGVNNLEVLQRRVSSGGELLLINGMATGRFPFLQWKVSYPYAYGSSDCT